MTLDDLPENCPLQETPQTMLRPPFIAIDPTSPTGYVIASDEYDPILLGECPKNCSFDCNSPSETLKIIIKENLLE